MPGTKISDAAGQAFAAGVTFYRAAWSVQPDMGDVALILHGNIIAKRQPGSKAVKIWTRGYVTPTTMRGINAALEAMDMPWRACIKKGKPFLYSIGFGNQIMRPLVEGMMVEKIAMSGNAPTLSREEPSGLAPALAI
jgi:hypothetical protein